MLNMAEIDDMALSAALRALLAELNTAEGLLALLTIACTRQLSHLDEGRTIAF